MAESTKAITSFSPKLKLTRYCVVRFPYQFKFNGKTIKPDLQGFYPFVDKEEEEMLQFQCSRGLIWTETDKLVAEEKQRQQYLASEAAQELEGSEGSK